MLFEFGKHFKKDAKKIEQIHLFEKFRSIFNPVFGKYLSIMLKTIRNDFLCNCL